MGWKLLKDIYKIEHIVQAVYDRKDKQNKIYIGSPYISDIIILSEDGKILKEYREHDNDNLVRYMKEFKDDEEKLRRIVQTPDAWDETYNKTAYIVDYDCNIKECLYQGEIGYPNVTNEGELMYNNTAYDTYDKAYRSALYKSQFPYHFRKDVKYRLKEGFERITKTLKYFLSTISIWLKVRTVLRIKNLMH